MTITNNFSGVRFLFAAACWLLAAPLLFPGCSGSPSKHPVSESQWTILVFLNADNDLEEFGIADVNEMESVGSSPEVNVVVQMDRIAGYDSSNGNWTGARRYLIQRDDDTAGITSPVLQDLGEIDMADPQVLTDFVQWGKAAFPAQHYGLVIWNHGSGWRHPRPTRGISFDDTSAAFMSIPQLGTALDGQQLDIVAFDACLMAMAEVAYEIRNSALIMVASEEDVPAEGYPYYGDPQHPGILQPLVDNPAMTPSQFASVIVNQTVDYLAGRFDATHSAVDLSKIGPVTSAADQLARALIANSSTYGSQITSARNSSQAYSDNDFKDAFDFAQRVKEAAPVSDVIAAADALSSAIAACTITERHSGTSVANSHGLSIYLPAPADFDAGYSQLAFAQATSWDEWLQDLPSQASWTFMVFLNADNDLEEFGVEDMNEMEVVGSTSQVNIVVQMDRTRGYDSSNGDWTGCRRYLVQRDDDFALITSPILADLGEIDMGDPDVLRSFVQWAQQNYPAQHYLLDIWNHGAGWRNRSLAAAKGVSFDDTSGTFITTPQLPSALQGLALDIIAFDASLMGMAEIAYEIRSLAPIMVASEESPPGEGYPYHRVLQPLIDSPSLTPSQLASSIVNETVDYLTNRYKATESAIDLSKMAPVASAADQLADALQANYSTYASEIASARESSQSYAYFENKDAYHFAQLVKQSVPQADVISAADNLMSAISNALILERHWGTQVANSHGLAIYLPSAGGFLSSYRNLSFAQSTSWDEFLTSQTQ